MWGNFGLFLIMRRCIWHSWREEKNRSGPQRLKSPFPPARPNLGLCPNDFSLESTPKAPIWPGHPHAKWIKPLSFWLSPQYNPKRCFLCSIFVLTDRNLFICSILRNFSVKRTFWLRPRAKPEAALGRLWQNKEQRLTEIFGDFAWFLAGKLV